jgi:queuosine precursor transporter
MTLYSNSYKAKYVYFERFKTHFVRLNLWIRKFIANALLAELIGGKIFSVEKTLGLQPAGIYIFGNHLPFNLTAGVLLWPVVFILTDIINEYFGKKGVRFLSYFAVGLISYAFVMIYFSIGLKPADFYISSQAQNGIANMNDAFQYVFGQGLWIIVFNWTNRRCDCFSMD